MRVQGCPAVGHENPGSRRHVSEQPSVATTLPSSQYSRDPSTPSPQTFCGAGRQGPPAPSAAWETGKPGLGLGTVVGTSVAGYPVAVIALLTRVDFAVPAGELAGHARERAGVARFDRTVARAAISRNAVAVVAFLAPTGLHDAIAARFVFGAGAPGGNAGIAALVLAGRVASVGCDDVTVVAGLAEVHLSVAASRSLGANAPRRGTCPPRLDAAGRRTAIAVDRVVVVARFAWLEQPVAAHLRLGEDARSSVFGTVVPILDSADARAAVTRVPLPSSHPSPSCRIPSPQDPIPMPISLSTTSAGTTEASCCGGGMKMGPPSGFGGRLPPAPRYRWPNRALPPRAARRRRLRSRPSEKSESTRKKGQARVASKSS